MSIQEASQLILQCAAYGKKADIFLLDMGKPIKILQLAKDLIRLSGFEPELDIPIVYSGLRPGEKLYEELQLKDERKIYTNHKKIMILKGTSSLEKWESLSLKIDNLLKYGEDLDGDKIQRSLKSLLPNFQPRSLEILKNDNIVSFKHSKAIA